MEKTPPGFQEYLKFLNEKLIPYTQNKFQPAVRPVFILLENKRLEQVGSLTLIEIDGLRYLITAAHVFDHYEKGMLFTSISDVVQPLHPKFLVSEKPNNRREDDHFDFAIQCMEGKNYKHIDDQIFINQEDLALKSEMIADGPHMCLGYPNSKNKRPLNTNPPLKVNIWSYISSPQLSDNIYIESGYDAKSHILINYSDKKRYDKNLKKTGPIAAKGLSGGVVIMMGIDQESDRLYKSNALVIIIEYRKNTSSLACIRFSEIYRRAFIREHENTSMRLRDI